ncbi:glucose-1-phosphate adenylyltransferase subunit GlgD [Caldisalinibacter kiritimatiensis]|uniref:Glycogen biosynthesis protein GlgD, glucose-1-phosphate adenylyltransferase family n=1 Tax=Caldisalinibacter kiritimatiensis TaxID=1304284 RepID=R1CE33_9FIRM|nr:glucose-1-phosphate adenylyltransferase subunit GlgD [Caldisalinibacter kiritimatiensis]EOD00530.1 Glycogen biosynthesis protein GlgD, glucose-1-phosphate adenylyltransferase family [Caldisalinibacter kiritimatiensis]
MLNKYLGIISSLEKNQNFGSLVKHRPLASLPIFGRYRMIDFILSNMVNSGIDTVGVFTNNSRSLVDHLGTGKPWELDRKIGGLFIFDYCMGDILFNDIKLLKDNIEFIYRSKKKYVLLSSPHMIYNIDFKKMAYSHEKSGKDITVVYKRIKNTDDGFLNCDTLNINDKDGVSIGKNLGASKEINILIDTFIFKTELLLKIIHECIEKGNYISLKNAILKNIKTYTLNLYEFKGTVKCINSLKAYYKSSMDMLDLSFRKELFFKNGQVYTKPKDSQPTKYLMNSNVKNSIVADGCTIKGRVENSIISRGVVIEENVEIKDSIIFQNSHIKKGAKLQYTILDKNTVIEEGKKLIGDINHPLVIERQFINKLYFRR